MFATLSLKKKKNWIDQTKLRFFAKVKVPLARFSESEESLTKHEKQFKLTDHEIQEP
jgi:hypothetical protein